MFSCSETLTAMTVANEAAISPVGVPETVAMTSYMMSFACRMYRPVNDDSSQTVSMSMSMSMVMSAMGFSTGTETDESDSGKSSDQEFHEFNPYFHFGYNNPQTRPGTLTAG